MTGIPLKDISDPYGTGVIYHSELGSDGCGHSDPGYGYPLDKVLEWAKGGTTPAPKPPEEEDDEMLEIPTGGPDIGFSFPKYYTSVGFCADPGRISADAVVKIHMALHRKDSMQSWEHFDITLTREKPKAVVNFQANYDGASFIRHDDNPITVIPNFK